MLVNAIAGAVGASPSVVAVRRVRDVTYALTPSTVYVNPDFAGDSFPAAQRRLRRLSGTGSVSLDVQVTLGSNAAAASLSSALAASASELASKIASALSAAGWSAPTAAQVAVVVQPYPVIGAAAGGAPAPSPVPLVAGTAAGVILFAVVAGVLVCMRIRAKSNVGVVVNPMAKGGRPGPGNSAREVRQQQPAALQIRIPATPSLSPDDDAAAGIIDWAALVPDMNQKPLHGGMGAVFKARWQRPGMDVAVKLLRASTLSAEEYAEAAESLQREAEALRVASRRSMNRWVVPLYGTARGAPTQAWADKLGRQLALYESRSVGSDVSSPEIFGLVMAWQDGGTLAERLHGAGRPVWLRMHTAERLLLLERAAEGVALLHSAQPNMVVHGDIKSENLLLTSGGEPRLSDFGLAQVKRAVTTADNSSTRRHPNNSTAAAGTWHYMAPEMFAQRSRSLNTPAAPASRTTDVYALTTLCWEALVVERPWGEFDDSSRIAALRNAENLDWERLPDDVPIALRGLLERGTAFDRAQRPTARELCDGLRAARELLESGRFDVFLSHAWEGKSHAPVTAAVHRALHADHRRLWVDTTQMGHSMPDSMREGVAASAVFVVLVSRHYASRRNCLLELRAAKKKNKPIVAVLVEPDESWWPSTVAGTLAEQEVAAAIDTMTFQFADLRAACAADAWARPVVDAQRVRLNAPTALPMLLRLVRDALAVQQAGGGGGIAGGGGGSSRRTRLPPLPLPLRLPLRLRRLLRALRLLPLLLLRLLLLQRRRQRQRRDAGARLRRRGRRRGVSFRRSRCACACARTCACACATRCGNRRGG